MAPRVFSSRALAVALLALLAITSNRYVQQAHASTFAVNDASGLDISSSAIEKVASDKQLDANQLFAKTWYIKGNAAKNISVVDYIRLIVPGRVFITYAENSASSPSGAIGEVKVSGSSEAVVNVVEAISNNTAAGPKLVVLTTSTATEGEYLLTEIQLFTKNALRVVVTKGSADVVILEDVLYSKSEGAVQKTGSRRLSGEKSAIVVEEKKTTDARTGRSQKIYYLKPASGSLSDVHNVDLSLEIEGYAALVQMDPDDGNGEYVGYMTVTDTSLDRTPGVMDQVKLANSHGSNSEVLKLQSTASSSASSAQFKVYMMMVPSVKVKTTSVDSMQVSDYLGISYNDRFQLIANGTGDIFISDKNLTLYADYVTFDSTGSGSLQVDVADIVADDSFAMYAWGSGNVTYLGQRISSLTTADVRGKGRICLAPTNKPIVTVTIQERSNQVSYPGKRGNTFTCIKTDLPQRVSSRIGANEQATAVAPAKGAGNDKNSGSSPTSVSSSSSQGLQSASMVALLPTAAMISAAFD